jgi:uncharacterized membrane protein
MPDDVPQTLVGIAFSDGLRAQEFLTATTRLAVNKQLVLRDAVFIAKTDDGHTVVHETIDPSPGRSALTSAMWTGLVGLILAGPIGLAAGAAVGAGTGAVTAKVVDLGIPDKWVAWFREAAQPGKTILALLVTDLNREALLKELERFEGAHLVYANLDEATLERMRTALGEAHDKTS